MFCNVVWSENFCRFLLHKFTALTRLLFFALLTICENNLSVFRQTCATYFICSFIIITASLFVNDIAKIFPSIVFVFPYLSWSFKFSDRMLLLEILSRFVSLELTFCVAYHTSYVANLLQISLFFGLY